MKIGIISDIHSNICALRACTARLEALGCDEYFFLGDYVSDTPYTRETLDFLYQFRRSHPCRMLRGNREEYMLAQRETLQKGDTKNAWIYNSASGNLKFTYDQLTEEDFAFFESLPITFRFEKPGFSAITCCHGSPENARELVFLDTERSKYWLDRIDTDYLVCAHTHRYGQCSHAGKTCFNSGCAGIAIGTPGEAQCMVLHSDPKAGWRAEFLLVPYDSRQVVRDTVSSGLLDKAPWFINCNLLTLLTGIDHAAEMVAEAHRLSAAENGESIWPLISEEHFEKAAAEYHIPDYRKCRRSLLENGQP